MLKMQLMKKTVTLIFGLIYFGNIAAQQYTGSVHSFETKKPLDFPSVTVRNGNKFKVCNTHEKGNFTIELNNANEQDTLIIAYLGYENKLIPISQLKGGSSSVFYLKKRTYLLNQVDIVQDALTYYGVSEPVKKREKTTIGWRNIKKEIEAGIVIKNDTKVLLKSIHIPIHYCSYDTVYAKLNVYTILSNKIRRNSDKPKGNKLHNIELNDLLKESFYIEFSNATIKNGYVIFDVEQFNIIVEKDFLVSIEFVKDMGDGILTLDAVKNGNTYGRLIKGNMWTSTNSKIAMKIGVREFK